METSVYEREAAVEATHWWFVGRRKLFAAEIARAGVPKQARVLDVGTGTGTNLRMLRELGFHHVTGMDFSDDAIRFCREKGFGPVHKGDICALPFPDASFDLVLATDIVEHVDDEASAMREVARVLAPAGVALITAPAFGSLWGTQDELSRHRRRYVIKRLSRIVSDAALDIVRCYYFNYLLFVPIWAARKAIYWLRVPLESESQVNTALINRCLSAVFDLDIRTAPVLRPPFGVSILVVARKGSN